MGLPTDTLMRQTPPHSPKHVAWGREADFHSADNLDPTRKEDRAGKHMPKYSSPIY